MSVEFNAKRVGEFLESYSDSFSDIEMRCVAMDEENWKVCAGWVTDFLKKIEFIGYERSDVVGSWVVAKKERFGTLYTRSVWLAYKSRETDDMLILRANVDTHFSTLFFDTLRALNGKRLANASRERVNWNREYSGVLNRMLLRDGQIAIMPLSRAGFAEYVSGLGSAFLKWGNYEAWDAWSKWVLRLLNAFNVKELKPLVRRRKNAKKAKNS